METPKTRKQLLTELEKTQKEQQLDLYANFSTRLGRYVKIRLIRWILNTQRID